MADVDRALAELYVRVQDLTLRDERRLRRRLDSAGDAGVDPPALDRLRADIEMAERAITERRQRVPTISYPPQLPIVEAKDEIAAAIRDHQVVIVAGETGSGKTTQLPKICLELGRGVRGVIGHTQPRRLAARTVAERIAAELETSLGDAVGYKVRFTDQVGVNSYIKLMTDGILLAEIQRDRYLNDYDTLIIDEAHERSLNVDFILGYVKQLLPRRSDLRLIVTSATIDPQRFSAHFDDAPVVEVSGRVYPVEVRYRPLVDDVRAEDLAADDASEPRDQIQAICGAVRELVMEGPGDLLVFLSGEREIRDTAEAVKKLALRQTEVMPLYGRLSASEQHRVFEPHNDRRVVLATNVAETSLTVPGIRFVVDPGTARISRYSQRTKVQRLPIEPISQASANQRKGRCGRTSDGICIRLYSEDDFASRPEFTEPEILRTNLASVILQMAALGLGDVAAFPFVEPPDRRQVNDGVQLLEELGAFDPAQPDARKRLTVLGRRLAQLPVDPRIGRMVLQAGELGCAREVIIVAAALSIQDPRERPLDRQQAADERHARFADKDSDFVAHLNLWEHLREQQKLLSSSRFRMLCKTEFLSFLRVREWQDVEGQLRQVAKSLGVRLNNSPGDRFAIHQSVLAGLLSHIGMKDVETRDYLGARGARFAIFPGSALFRTQPRWVMAAELVETSRLWGRFVAKIEPEWAESLAAHLVKRSYSEPHWEADQGSVMAFEKVTLYGVPIVAARKISYGRVDPELSRELFIRHALVEGDWSTRHRFFHDNLALLAEVEELERRTRRRDIVVDDETLFAFYDARVPSDVVSAQHFDSWWKQVRASQPDRLAFSAAMLVTDQAPAAVEEEYPDSWRIGDLELPVRYEFEPGAESDGVTVRVPLRVLNRVDADSFSWQLPGLRLDLVTALLRSLPKHLRRSFVPAPEVATDVMPRLDSNAGGSLPAALADELHRSRGIDVRAEDFDLDRLPSYLRITFEVVGPQGSALGRGKDLDELKARLAPTVRSEMAHVAADIERTGLRRWDFGVLPPTYEKRSHGLVVRGFPALVDEGSTVGVRVLDTAALARRSTWIAIRRLLLLNVASPAKLLQRQLGNDAKLGLSRAPGGATPLLDDCLTAALDELIAAHDGAPHDADTFEKLLVGVRAELGPTLTRVVTDVVQVIAVADDIDQALRGNVASALQPSLIDMRAQREALVHRGFVTEAGARRLPDVTRYLWAIERRLEKFAEDVNRDRARQWEVEQVTQAYAEARERLAAGRDMDDDVLAIRWMIEELRVSLFAQTLGTPGPVSLPRILRAIDALA
jgi:ATP-dependent helicase HrpA